MPTWGYFRISTRRERIKRVLHTRRTLFIAHYGAKLTLPVKTKIIAMIQNIMSDEDSINEMIAIPFFSVFFVIVMTESMIPATVRAAVI